MGLDKHEKPESTDHGTVVQLDNCTTRIANRSAHVADYTVSLSNCFFMCTEKIIVVLHQSTYAQLIRWFNPHRFRTASMLVSIPDSPDRSNILHHTAVCPSMGNYGCTTVLAHLSTA